MSIQFFFVETSVALSDRKKLKLFLEKLFINNAKKLEKLSFIFCSDDYLLKINKEFLQHDFYTDIITFNLAGRSDPIDGEIYISVDRIKENAKIHKVQLKQEMHRVIFHGALHLCGYKDKSKIDKIKMTTEEDNCLNSYFN